MAKKKLFDPDPRTPFPLSRTKVDLFIECPRCFYLDRRLGISRPAGFPFNLNSAVDALPKVGIRRPASSARPDIVSTGDAKVPISFICNRDSKAVRELQV